MDFDFVLSSIPSCRAHALLSKVDGMALRQVAMRPWNLLQRRKHNNSTAQPNSSSNFQTATASMVRFEFTVRKRELAPFCYFSSVCHF